MFCTFTLIAAMIQSQSAGRFQPVVDFVRNAETLWVDFEVAQPDGLTAEGRLIFTGSDRQQFVIRRGTLHQELRQTDDEAVFYDHEQREYRQLFSLAGLIVPDDKLGLLASQAYPIILLAMRNGGLSDRGWSEATGPDYDTRPTTWLERTDEQMGVRLTYRVAFDTQTGAPVAYQELAEGPGSAEVTWRFTVRPPAPEDEPQFDFEWKLGYYPNRQESGQGYPYIGDRLPDHPELNSLLADAPYGGIVIMLVAGDCPISRRVLSDRSDWEASARAIQANLHVFTVGTPLEGIAAAPEALVRLLRVEGTPQAFQIDKDRLVSDQWIAIDWTRFGQILRSGDDGL